MFDLEKFKNGEFFVHLPTEEIYNEAMEFLDDNGFKWVNGSSLTDSDGWSKYGKQTCIRHGKRNVLYYDLNFYETEGYKQLEINKYEKGDIDMNEKIKRDLIVSLFENEFGFEIDYGHVLNYKGRIIFKSLDDTARFIDFIEELRAEYMVTGREVAKAVIDKLNINDYEFEKE